MSDTKFIAMCAAIVAALTMFAIADCEKHGIDKGYDAAEGKSTQCNSQK